jgi:hypothetical protein
MRRTPMRYSELMKRLKEHGVTVKDGGKGSETILHRPLDESGRGPQYTIKKHGDNPEIDWRIIKALLKSLGLHEEAVWFR